MSTIGEQKQSSTSSSRSKPSQFKPKRKPHRACDFCRRRKIKCDGYEMEDNRCTICLDASVECTYARARRGQPDAGYVKGLETKLANMEKLFGLISPHVDTSKVPDFNLPTDLPAYQRSKCHGDKRSVPEYRVLLQTSDEEDAEYVEKDEYVTMGSLQQSKALHVDEIPRFYGGSSEIFFVKSVMDVKHGVDGVAEVKEPVVVLTGKRRPEYWELHSWMNPTLRPKDHGFHFPEPSMTSVLIELYFENMNIFFPLLHRPSFDICLAKGLHLRDDGFACVLLLVCAIGCRFSDDPYVTHHPSKKVQYPTGWELFHQVRRLRRRFLPHSIHDLHVYCKLSALFLEHSATSQAAWILIGTGLRFVQEVGAHRRRMYGPKPTVVSELWKRAFWVLLVLDRLSASNLGRRSALQTEDFDLDPPIECDDEYWTPVDPEQAFKQPKNKPSSVTFFVSLIKLNQILAFALRTVYSIKKSKISVSNSGQQWDERVVAELDSAVNKWANTVPDCVRWDPKRQDLQFFRQSVVLYCHYYDLQILIHRHYISSKISTLSLPSIAICASAARSSCHMVYHAQPRMGLVMNQCLRSIFTSALMLMLNAWVRKSIGHPVDYAKEMEEVGKCQLMLKGCEGRWLHASQQGDILDMFRNGGDVPFYRPRNGDSRREFLWNSNYSRFCMGGTFLDGIPETSNKWPAPEDKPTSTPDLENNSEETTRLPFHLEQLFSDPSMSNSQADHADFARDTTTDPGNPISFEENDDYSLLPVELLMYNDLMEDHQITDFTSRVIPQNHESQISGYQESFNDQFGSGIVLNGAEQSGCSSSVPTTLENWGDWALYESLFDQPL